MPSIPALFTRLRHKKNSSSSSSNLSSPSTPNFGNSDRAQRKSLPPTPRDGHADRNGESHDRYASGRDSDDSPSRYRRSMDDRPRRDVSHNLPSQSPRKPVAAGDVVVNPARPAPPPPTKDQARSQDPSRVSEVVQHAQRDASSSLQYTTDNNTLPRHPYTSLHPYIDNSYIDSNASSPNIPILSSDTQSAFPLPPHTLPVMSALNDRSGSLSPSGNGLSKDDVRSVEHRKEKPVFNSMSRARKSEEGHVGRYSVQSDITPLSQVDGSRSGEQYLDLPTDAQTSLSQEIRESLQNEHGLSVGGETKRAGRDRKSLDASDIDIPKRGTSLHHDNGTGTPIAAVPLVDERGIGTRSHLTPEQFIAPYLANLSIRGTPHSPNTQPSEGHKHAFTGLPRLHHRKEESKDADYSHFNSPELEKLRQEQIQSIIVGAQKRRSERKALDQFGRDLFQKANMAHLIDTPDTVDIETTYLKPVIQETIIPREHIEYKTVIRRERHKHHIYPKIQPIEDPNPRILEPRHRIFSPQTGKWHEVIGDQAAIEILGEDVFRNGPKEVRHKRQIDWDVLHGLISDTRETSASPGVVGTALTKLSQDELTKKGLGTGGKGRIVERRGIVGKPLSDWAEVGRAKIPGSETVSPGSIGVAV